MSPDEIAARDRVVGLRKAMRIEGFRSGKAHTARMESLVQQQDAALDDLCALMRAEGTREGGAEIAALEGDSDPVAALLAVYTDELEAIKARIREARNE